MAGEMRREWERTIEWRQGHVLTADACRALGLSHSTNVADTCVVVISHDCDLANDNLVTEPNVEVIIGRVVDTTSPAFTRTKNPRRLHMESRRDDIRVAIELDATAKRLIPKSRLATSSPDIRYRLDPTGLETLRHWLSLRYCLLYTSDAADE